MGLVMQGLTSEQVSGKVSDHLGLVSVMIDRLPLTELIDERLPLRVDMESKVSMDKRVTAMILNGLGFIDGRLYLFEEFLKNKPVDRLLGDGVKAEDFSALFIQAYSLFLRYYLALFAKRILAQC